MKTLSIGIAFALVAIGLLFLTASHLDAKREQACVVNGYAVTTPKEALEYGYFEGQKDYRNGDVRIRIYGTGECDWCWTKNPWDNCTNPPSYGKTCLQAEDWGKDVR